jgi:DNA polymerase-3 subunit delta
MRSKSVAILPWVPIERRCDEPIIAGLRITPEKLTAALQRNLAPVYLLSGAEPLTQGEAGDAIRAAARAAGFTEREVFFVERAAGGPWDEIFASCQALSLFAARRIVEVRIPAAKPGTEGARALQELVGSAGPDLLLLVIVGELDWSARKAAWVQALDGAGVWVDAEVPPLAQFPAWLRTRAAAEGLELADDAVAVLVEQTEGNLLAAVQELRKLTLSGVRRAGAAEVLASAAQSSRYDVTQLGEAVLLGDVPRALKVLAGLRAEGHETPLVLWTVWQELRMLWLTLVPGAPVSGIFSRNRDHLAAAAARLRPLGRAFFARLDTHMAEVDLIAKGRRHGNAWDELALVVAAFAGGRTILDRQGLAA